MTDNRANTLKILGNQTCVTLFPRHVCLLRMSGTPAGGIIADHSPLPDRRGHHSYIADLLLDGRVNAQVSHLTPAQMFSNGGWSGPRVTEL